MGREGAHPPYASLARRAHHELTSRAGLASVGRHDATGPPADGRGGAEGDGDATIGTVAGLGLIVGLAAMNAGCWELIPTIARATEGDTATEPAYEDEWGGGEIDVRAQARFGSLGEVESFEGNIWHDGSSSRVQGTVEYDWR